MTAPITWLWTPCACIPEINLIFGINDDSILAGMQAYHDLGRDKSMLIAVSIGAEGNTIFDALMGKGPLKACMAMFPEVVGRLAIDTVRHLWRANRNDFNVITPTALLTAENINEFYVKNENHWQFINEEIVKAVALPGMPKICVRRKRAKGASLSPLVFVRMIGIKIWPKQCTRAPNRSASSSRLLT